MKIETLIKDSKGQHLEINDVVMIEYPNPCMRFIGVLVFSEQEYRLVISDNDVDERPLAQPQWAQVTLLGRNLPIPKIERHFGLLELESSHDMHVFLEALQQLFQDLNAETCVN